MVVKIYIVNLEPNGDIMKSYLKNEKINEEIMNMSEYRTLKGQYRRFTGRDSAFWLSHVSEIKEIIGDALHVRVLDVGCGIGSLLLELSTHKTAKVYGIDFVQERIIFLKKRAELNNVNNVKCICGDAIHLPFKNESFDLVVSSQFFEHVTDIDKALEEQIRILKRGGKLFIDQANFMSIRSLVDKLILVTIKTKGKSGGLRWLLHKKEIVQHYHRGKPGRNEDIKSLVWWNKKMKDCGRLRIEYIHSALSKKYGIENIFLKALVSFFSRNIHIACVKE